MILRWSRKAVKRRARQKTPLPTKSAGCPVPLFINRAGRTLPGADIVRQIGLRYFSR